MAVRTVGVVATASIAVVAAALAGFAFTHPVTEPATLRGPIALLDLSAGVTTLAAPFASVLAVLDVAAALWSVRRGRAIDGALIAAFSAAMLLVLCARSVALFLFAWEAMALASVILVLAHHEKREVRRAAQLYLIVSQTGAACIAVALAILAVHAQSPAFAAISASAPTLPPAAHAAVLVLALAGFGSKAGLVPLHFWLPRAHPVAPAHASALLSGAMLNVAVFGLASVTLQLAHPAPAWFAVALVALGTLSAVVGILYALVDRDLKRLLAYSSVENVGIITAGLGGTLLATADRMPAVAALLLAATLFQMMNHGAFKGLLFLGAGAVSDSEGTVDLEKLGGLNHTLVWTAPAFFVGCAAIAALPPLNGFVSEWLIFRGLANQLHAATIATRFVALGAIAGLALSGGLAAACFVRAYGIAFLGVPRRATPSVRRERFDASSAALVFLAALCIAAGLLPGFAFAPLAHVAAVTIGTPAEPMPTLPVLPIAVAIVPVACGLLAYLLATRRGVRLVPTWSCGSPLTAAMQYTATAFTKPLRIVFAFVLRPERARVEHGGQSQWFPERIVYRTSTRYVVDETARRFGSLALRAARRSQLVQSGSLRLYLTYAIAAVIVAVAASR